MGVLFPLQIGNGSQLVTASDIAKILNFRHQHEKRVTLEIVQAVFEELHLQAGEDYSQSGTWNMVHGIVPERKGGMKELEMARKEILQALQAAMAREQRSVACGGRLMSFSRHLLGRGISLRADGSFDGSEGAGLHKRRFSTQHRAVWMHEEPYIVFAVPSTPTATLDLLLLPHRSIMTLKLRFGLVQALVRKGSGGKKIEKGLWT